MTDPVSLAELDYIAWAYERGDTLLAIARHLDRDKGTIIRKLAKLGLSREQPAGRPTRLSPVEVERLRELVPKIGINRTAMLLNVGEQLVSRWAQRLGVKSPWQWKVAKERP